MHSRKGHQDSVGRCRLFLGLLIFFASIFSIASSTLAAPAKTALDGTTSGPPKADAWLRSPEGMEVPTGCIIAGISYAFGETCWPTQKVSDCRSTQYTCTNDTQCSPQDVLKLSGLCSDPVGGVRSTCCDPPPACDSSGTCVQPAATVCPGQNLKTCTESVCDCTKRGQCEIRELNPLLCMANIGGCACVYPAPPNDSAVGQDQCKQACQEIGTTQFFYDSRGYCVCTGSGRTVCPNTAIGKPLMTDLTYPKTCSSLSLSWASPAPLVYGQVLPLSYLNAQVSPTGVSGTMTYTYKDPSTGADILLRAGHAFEAGTYQLKAVFTPEDKELGSLTATISLVVQKKVLSITMPNVRKVYGAANPTLTFTVTGFVYDDTFLSVFGNKTPETIAGTLSGVGNYPITLGLPTVKNYTVSSQPSATLFVDPVEIGCRAENKKMLVKAAVPQFTYVCTPFIGSDTASIFGGTGILSAPSLDTSKAADYTITFAPPPSHPNYTVVTANGTLSVYADCVVSNWSVPANPACGTTYLATRTVTTQAANGGTACPYLTETRTAGPCCGTALGSKSIACWFKTGTGSGCSCQPTAATLASPYSTLLTTISNANPGFLGCFYSGGAGDSLVGVSGNYEGRLTYFDYQDAGSIVGGNTLTQASYAYLLDVYDVSACKQDCLMSAWVDSPNQPACGATKTQSRTIIKPAAYGGVACGPTQQTISNTKCSVTLTWNTPAAIAYGTALSAAQLNATATSNGANVQGTFTYTYPLGTVLDAGTFANTVKFTPNDLNTYAPPGSVSVQQVVTKKALVCSALDQRMAAGTSAPNLTWKCANGFVLNQTAAVFTTQPTLTLNGANTKVGGNYPITFFQKPQAANYTISTGDGTMQVYADCVLGEYQPQYSCYFNGGEFSQTQQIITPSVNGGTCSPQTRQIVCPKCPCAGCVDGWRHVAGRSTLASLFGLGANDKVGIAVRDYNFREICKNLLGASAVEAVTYRDYQVMKFDSPGDNKFCGFLPVIGGALSSPLQKGCVAADGSTGYLSQLYCGCDMNGPNVCGNNRIDPSNYEECDGNVFPSGVSASAGCTADCKIFAKKVPVLSWAKPDSIVFGTALSGIQLNASALFNSVNVAGTFTYSPASGAVLAVGRHTLTANFAPTDTAVYNSADATTVEQVVVKKEMPCVIADASRPYGDASNPIPTFSCSGFVGTDTQASIFGAREPTSAANQTSAVGSNQSYTLNLPTSDKYTFVVSGGKLTITARPLEVIADSKAKAVGENNPPLTYKYVGLVNGDTETQAGVLVTAATKDSLMGPHDITFQSLPKVSVNYALKDTKGILSVGGSIVNCIVAAAARPYGDANPKFPFSCTGFLGTDTQASVFGTTAPTTTAVGTSPAGNSYDITLTAPQSTKYTFNITNAKLTINRASLKCDGIGFNRPYGEANKTLSTVCSGYKLSDGPSILATTGTFKALPLASDDVGTYTVGYDHDPVANGNYTVIANPATVTITQQLAECQADDKFMMVNATIPPLTQTCKWLVLSQSQTIFGAPPLEVDGATNIVGTPKIKYTAQLTHKNYEIRQVVGTMTVTGKNPTTCKWATPAALIYGSGLSTRTITTNGAQEDKGVAGTFKYTLPNGQVLKGGEVLDAGTTTLTATFTPTETATNEGCTCTTQQVVNPSPVITCQGSVQSRTYGENNSALNFSCTNDKGTDVIGLITNATSVTFAAGPARTAAVQTDPYDVVFATAPTAGSNYSITYVPAKVSVTKRSLDCGPNNAEMPIGSSVPPLTAKCSGFATDANGVAETVSSLASQGTIGIVGEPSKATVGGTYEIVYTASPTSGNYSIAVKKGMLTVNQLRINWAPAPLEINKAIGSAQLNATNSAGIAGSYTYSKSSGSYAIAADYLETVAFVPSSTTDQTKYGSKITAAATIQVFKNCVLGGYPTPACGTGTQMVTQIITEAALNGGTCLPGTQTVTAPVCATTCSWAMPSAITYGTLLPATTFDSNVGGAKESSSIPGSFTYTHQTGQSLGAGTHTMTATFAPTETAKYSGSQCSTVQTVNKAPTQCTVTDVQVLEGTALATSLVVSSAGVVGGSFGYSFTKGGTAIAVGTVLKAGDVVNVVALFTPSAPNNYSGSTCSGTITVKAKTAVSCTMATVDVSVNESLTKAALEAKSAFTAADSAALAGAWSYKYTSTNQAVAYGVKVAKGSYGVTATFVPTNSGQYAEASCAGTLRVSDCSIANQATDCNDNNDCTTDTCSATARTCAKKTYLGEQGSLGPTMTITCPNTLTLRWNDTLKCVNPSESPQYALGVDSSTAPSLPPSLPNYPGNLKSMSTTKVDRLGCSGGTCTQVFTDIPSVYFENGKTLYGGVGSMIMGALQKQSATSASGTCAAMCVEDGSCVDSQMTASSINRNCDCCYKTADGVIDKDTCEQYANYAPGEALTCNCPDIAPCPRGNIVLNSTGRLVCGTTLQELCGNGFINENVGEQCDGTTLPANAPAGSTCSVCKLISPPPINGGGGGAALCGNGIVDTAVGETCDTGNGATAGCRSGCKCVGCKLDCTGGGCKTLVGIQCNNHDASGNVKCTIKTSWGPTAIVTDVSGTETDCSDRNCCPSNGTDTKSVTYPNKVANCMKFTTACPNNKGSLLVPDGFQYTHSPTWVYNPSVGENQIGYKYRCISPGDEGCACGVGTKGCPLADTPEPK